MLNLATKSTLAASSVYASAEYGYAVAEEEGGTWKNIHDSSGEWQLPLVFRQISGTDFIDAATPYGYAGLHIDERLSDDKIKQYWKETLSILKRERVVSVFLRFPPFIPQQSEQASKLEGLTVAKVARTVLVPTGADEIMWSRMTRTARNKVRVAKKAGCSVEIVEASPRVINEARSLYEQTMHKVRATKNYYFGDDYYINLAKLGAQLHIARVLDSGGTCVAASFILSDHRFAHYHLSGSGGTVPGLVNLLLWRVFQWAANNGMKAVHLGGGLTDGDSLFKFKSSFGGDVLDFALGKSVIQEDVYHFLVAKRARELQLSREELASRSFFPAYRVPG